MRERGHLGSRRRLRRLPLLLFLCLVSAGFLAFSVPLRSLDAPPEPELQVDAADAPVSSEESLPPVTDGGRSADQPAVAGIRRKGGEADGPAPRPCATVEEMGKAFRKGSGKESLRVRRLIQQHFLLHGAARVRDLPPDQFCREGFMIGKASEAGFGNEMYKVLTAAALSVMLNRSLIIGQTRGLFPFGDYVSYANVSFTMEEVKHLWRKNKCMQKYGRHLIVRTDDFEKPSETNVLCSDWRGWKQPIIWFQGTTDAVASQFFLKNIHTGMKNAAINLFGEPGSMQPRPNVFGELMRILIAPSKAIEDAVNGFLNGSVDPDVTLHMRMMSNRSVRAIQAALNCVQKALSTYQHRIARPRLVLVSDTPSFSRDIKPGLKKFVDILHFNYKLFEGSISNGSSKLQHQSDLRARDWGPTPRWVAFVDFFLASRAKHVVISGAHRRVGTTYAQLIAALAAANQLDEEASTVSGFSFFSSFQSNLLAEGLANQAGWGHVWNRFAGPLSCHKQRHQCAFTPLLPSAWWDTRWQSPISRDVRRLKAYGVQLTNAGEVIENNLHSFCKQRKERVRVLPIIHV